MKRTIGSNIGNEPRLGALVEANEIESYSFPQGVLSQLMREIAAGRPGLVTPVGLGTYVDPRQTGGKQNARTTEDLVELVTLRGREWLLFHAFPIDVAVIRGTTADEDGNLTMEGEAVQGEMLAMAMAARNSGGIVIAQVRQLATRGSLRTRDVKVPAALIDHVYVDPDQWQTYITRDSPYYAGAVRRPVRPEPPLPLDVRKIIARRSLLEFPRGRDLQPRLRDQPAHRPGRLGGGRHRPARADRGAGHLRRRAGRRQRGRDGLQLPGDDRPAGHVRLLRRRRARHREPVVRRGRRRGQRQRPRLRGPGPRPGRLPEHQRAKTGRINFVGDADGARASSSRSTTACGSSTRASLGKFVPEVREISFNGRLARERGQQVRYITERAVFALESDGLVLIEVAPGIDVERDVLGQMGFRPRVADDLADDGPRACTRPGRWAWPPTSRRRS